MRNSEREARDMTNPFKLIKLYFTERDYYEQRKRYMKLQKKYRKDMKAQVKEFCPWSGYYMHKMITTMLEFYYKTYEAKDCCWSESAWEGKTAVYLKEALDWAEKLDAIEDIDCDELIAIAQKDGQLFSDYLKQYEEKVGYLMDSEALLSGVAYSYLEKKYTKAMYNVIGEHIWEWMD
jgi:hypothetical protein